VERVFPVVCGEGRASVRLTLRRCRCLGNRLAQCGNCDWRRLWIRALYRIL